MKKRIPAIVMVIIGCLIGITYTKTGFCIGDSLFSTLGIPCWSNGTTGTHYPALVGGILALAGFGIFSCTLSQKYRWWFWLAIVLLIVILNFILSF